MDKETRNTLRNVVAECRRLLEEAVADALQGRYGIHAKTGKVEKTDQMGHLSEEELGYREELIAHLRHIESSGLKPKDAVAQLMREIAFTHLNRLAAYKMMEQRGLIREAVSRGRKSQGFLFYLADHPEEESLWTSGEQDRAYRHFLSWLGETLSEEIGVLFSPHDAANRLFPPPRVLEQVLDLINSDDLAGIWGEDETIGWIYQYFTPKELREQARKESSAPRNSYELAFRNQFYTPRYVVEFLTDNTLGRTWHEMRRGETALAEQCRYLVRRPLEVFLASPEDYDIWNVREGVRRARAGHFSRLPDDPSWGELQYLALSIDGYALAPRLGMGECGGFANSKQEEYHRTGQWQGSSAGLWVCLFYEQRRWRHFGLEPEGEDLAGIRALYRALRDALQREEEADLPQEELLRLPVYIPYRAAKDPRDLKILDPACGSGHFLLYCFDLLQVIYEEAWQAGTGPASEATGKCLHEDYPDLDGLRRAVPELILRHNVHGIDIDPRATQIAALALWLRAQRAYQELGLTNGERTRIRKTNIVCAEPMPGEQDLLEEFVARLDPPVLGDLVRIVFHSMKLAGEAGSLLKIEEELREGIAQAKQEWQAQYERARDGKGNSLLFSQRAMDEMAGTHETQLSLFDVSGVDDAAFFERAEGLVLQALRDYARWAANGRGLQRQLFVEDAGRGFGFVELCRRQYDAILMNPPFGQGSVAAEPYIADSYSSSSGNLLCAFIEQARDRLVAEGSYGCVVDRGLLLRSSFERFRQAILLGESPIGVVADLGWGVLDANVEVSAIAGMATNSGDAVAGGADVTSSAHKGTDLAATMQTVAPVALDQFLHAPFSAINFQIPLYLRVAFSRWGGIGGTSGAFCNGHTMKSDVFKRLVHELPLEGSAAEWRRMWNGSDYSPFYVSMQEAVLWRGYAEGVEAHSSTILRNLDRHGRAGLCYGKRGDFLDVQILPEGFVLTTEGFGGYFDSDTAWFLLGYLNSHPVQHALNSYSGQHKQVGYVNALPLPPVDSILARQIAGLARLLYDRVRTANVASETDPLFTSIWSGPYASCSRSSVSELVKVYHTELERLCRDAAALDLAVERLLAVPSSEKRRMHVVDAGRPDARLYWWLANKQDVAATRRYFAHAIISYCIGCCYGRWDVRAFSHAARAATLPEPFTELPAHPPGALLSADRDTPSSSPAVSGGLLPGHQPAPSSGSEGFTPCGEPCPDYPIRVDWDGVMVDDELDAADIATRVGSLLRMLCSDGADSVRDEICDAVCAADLRAYLRDARGFFHDHTQRYSRSTRKAPIYWPLQSCRRNYALWLYYQRLDKDMYYKALVNYVEPKMRLEENRLQELRGQLAGAGSAGRAAKRLEREVERQEAFVSELQDFYDKLRRVADLHLEPDLNDGVILNMAPLWELVPWKEPQKYWERLLAGEYEWSSIGKQLRERGLVK